MDALVALLAAVALLSALAGGRAMARSWASCRLLGRLAVVRPVLYRRAPGGPLLEGLTARIVAHPRGARLAARSAANHPAVPFSDVLAIGLASALAAWLFGWVVLGGALPASAAALVVPVVVDRVFVRLHGNRTSRLEKLLPEALALQARALRAGQSLVGSLQILADETQAPLNEELKRMLTEVDLGRPMDDALEDMVARVPSRDFDMWVTALIVHRQTGGNLAGVIDDSSSRMAQRLQLRSEIRAMTAQGRLSGLVVSLAPLAFFLLLSIGSRDQMEFLFTTGLGLAILAAGLTMNALGMIWIRHSLRVRL